MRKYVIILTAILMAAPFSLMHSKNRGIGTIRAYPNPFNPSSDTLTVDGSSINSATAVSFTVYDFNQEEIYSGTATSVPFTWSGYTKSGKRVSPGLYFIRIIATFSDNATGLKYIKVIVK